MNMDFEEQRALHRSLESKCLQHRPSILLVVHSTYQPVIRAQLGCVNPIYRLAITDPNENTVHSEGLFAESWGDISGY